MLNTRSSGDQQCETKSWVFILLFYSWNILCVSIYIHVYKGTPGVVVIVIGSGLGYLSSNPE